MCFSKCHCCEGFQHSFTRARQTFAICGTAVTALIFRGFVSVRFCCATTRAFGRSMMDAIFKATHEESTDCTHEKMHKAPGRTLQQHRYLPSAGQLLSHYSSTFTGPLRSLLTTDTKANRVGAH